MKNGIIKRNILFWGKYGVQLAGIMLGFLVLYGFLFNIGGDIGKFWETAYMYGLIISMLFAYMGPPCYSGAYIPMVISFGSGRKEALWGAQLRNGVYLVTAYVILLFTEFMKQGSLSVDRDILLLEGMILCSAIGQFCMAIQMHFGRKGFIVSIVCIAVIMAVGTFTGLMQVENIASAWMVISNQGMWMLLAGGALVAVAVYGISVVVVLRVMKNYEVKA